MERSFLIHCGLYSKNFAAPQNKKQSGVQFCRSVADMVKGGVVVFVYSDANSEVRAWAAPPHGTQRKWPFDPRSDPQ